jgi:hypothetical protein
MVAITMSRITEQINVVKAKYQSLVEFIRLKYSKKVVALCSLCFIIVGVRWLHEISWCLVLAPLLVLGTCLTLSSFVSLINSERFNEAASTWILPVISRIVPPHVYSRITSPISFIWWRLRISVQTTIKRVCHSSEELQRNKYIGSLLQQPNSHWVIICASLLIVYTIGGMFFGHAYDTSGETLPLTRHAGIPTIARPFIFLHVPGSGGVSFRKSLREDAIALRANTFLPCFDGLKCAVNTDQEFNKTFISQQSRVSQLTITQREMRCAAVIGGHFKV